MAAIESLAALVAGQMIGREPPELFVPHLAGLQTLGRFGGNPAAFVLLVAQNVAAALVVGILAHRFAGQFVSQRGLLVFEGRLGQIEKFVGLAAAQRGKAFPPLARRGRFDQAGRRREFGQREDVNHGRSRRAASGA